MSSSRSQHMVALARANEVRFARADLKRLVKAGEVTVAEVVKTWPWYVETMPLIDLLKAQTRWGGHRARKLLASCVVAENKTIGSMTPRQRDAVLACLAGEAPPSLAPRRSLPRRRRLPVALPSGQRLYDQAQIVFVLTGRGGKTVAEIEHGLREDQLVVADVPGTLARMRRRRLAWCDTSTGYELHGVDARPAHPSR